MAKKTIKAQMKQRRDTKANWAATNPVLLDGELGIVSDDPNLYKVGDGATAWNSLPFRGFDGTLAQELGTSPNAVISQKVVSEKLTELESKTDYLQEVKSINLFDPSDPDVLIGAYVIGADTIESASYNTTGFIPVEESKTYYCANDAGGGFRIVNYCNSDKVVFQREQNISSFIPPTGCKFVRVVFAVDLYSKAQVSLTSTNYVPYRAPYLGLSRKMGNEENSIVSKGYVDGFVYSHLQITDPISGIFYEALRDLNIPAGQNVRIKLEGTWSRVLVIYNGALSQKLIDSANDTILSGKWYSITSPTDIYSIGANVIDGSASLSIEYGIATHEGRIIDLENDVVEIQHKIEVSAESKGILYGKKYIACGDSFTHGDFTGSDENNTFDNAPYEGENKVYPFFIGRRTGAVVVNEAKNGSTMAYIDGSRNEFSAENGRYTQIPEDADYVTLYFGINDSHQSVPIGTIDDVVNTTFYGAWNIVMTWLLNNRPYAKLGIIITNGATPAYTDAERNIAKKYGVPFLDLELDEQIPYMLRQNERVSVPVSIRNLRDNQFKVGNGNSHPNAKCHELESTFIESFLLRL